MTKQVLIFNGLPRSGKTTAQEIISSLRKARSYSSIDYVKEVYADYFGWRGDKTERSRQFLSDMKKFLLAETDIIDKMIMEAYNDFMASDDEILMIDIREPEEIEKYKAKLNALTVLLVNPREPLSSSITNSSDSKVFEYKYDFMILNHSTTEQLREDIKTQLLSKLETSKATENKATYSVYLSPAMKGQSDLFIESADTEEEVIKSAFEYLKAAGLYNPEISLITRNWLNEEGDLLIDYGSWSTYIKVTKNE